MGNCRLKTENCILQMALLLSCLAAAGCRREIETEYGRRQGPAASTSVNGTAVLAEMFEQAGHEVFSWPSLSPRLQRADCIVWFPDDFEPPARDVRDWLEEWLYQQPGRTLIYVGRDFDAAGWYWEKIEPDAPPDQLSEIRRRKSEADSEFRQQRQAIPTSEDCDWFTVKGGYRRRKVRSLQGPPEWRSDVDPSKLGIDLSGRIIPCRTADVLLESEGDMLISRDLVGRSRLILVANGSFLLNLPLVNHQHRKLAGKLIAQVGPPSKTVALLESSSGGPPIREDDISLGTPTGLEILLINPTNWIFLHLAIVGVLFCFSRWPIFGRPRELAPGGRSDFGKHIQALGELLQRSGDRAYATTRVLHYQQTTKSNE